VIAIVWPVPEELDDCGAATQPVRASEVQLAVIEAAAEMGACPCGVAAGSAQRLP